MGFDPAWSSRRLESLRDELAGQLRLLAQFTPGSVSETWSKCGKANCHCARPGDPWHGPRLLWVRYEGGKTKTRTVPARLSEQVRAGVARGGEFTSRVQEIAQINAVLADRVLSNPPGRISVPGPGSSGEKGGS
jgi:hypothetical protein